VELQRRLDRKEKVLEPRSQAEIDREDKEVESLTRDLPEFKQPRFDLHTPRRLDDPDLDQEDPDLKLSSDSGSIKTYTRKVHSSLDKVAMFPFTVEAYDFKQGDWVKEILSEQNITNYVGVVIRIMPKANKVMVKWPFGIRQNDPEMLVLLNQEYSQAIARSSVKVSNLIRVAKKLRDKGYTDMQTFTRLSKAYGDEIPMTWLAGSVEIAYPKKTASFSANGELVREMLAFAQDLNKVYTGLPDKYRKVKWPS